MKTLEEIKREYARERGFMGLKHMEYDGMIEARDVDEVAIRYANEQKMELVEMLKECIRVLSSVQSPATPAILLRREIESLINSNISEL